MTIESRMDDVRAVMDAVGREHAVLLGLAESAATCVVFAASYPERDDPLVLFAPYVRSFEDEEGRARMQERIRIERERWGDRAYL